MTAQELGSVQVRLHGSSRRKWARDPRSNRSSQHDRLILWGSLISNLPASQVSSPHHLAPLHCTKGTQIPLINRVSLNRKGNSRDTLDLPPNNSAAGLASGIREAFISYGASTTGHSKCVIFLVQDGERNIFDQKHLEYSLQSSTDPVIPVFRLPFSEIQQHTRLADGPGRQLLYTPHAPVSTSYLRGSRDLHALRLRARETTRTLAPGKDGTISSGRPR